VLASVKEMEVRSAGLGGRAPREVIGVYVGWPGALYPNAAANSLTTFWNRLDAEATGAMKLWQFFRKHSDASISRVILVASISGLSNALLLAVVNQAAQYAEDTGRASWLLFAEFLIVIALYVVTQRYILHIASIEVERIVATLRISFADKIRRADLDSIEGLGRAQIYASVNTETMTISQAAAPLMIACQGATLVLFSLGYIYYISGWAFVLTVVIVGAGIAIHFSNRAQLARDLQTSTSKENEYFDVLTDLLEGFKEVKLNVRRSIELYQRLRTIATEAALLKTTTGTRYADYYIFTQVLFYSLIASMVFMLPNVASGYSPLVSKLTASILFITGPLTMVVGVLPIVAGANNAIQNIERLEAQLNRAQRAARQKENGAPIAAPAAFREIRLDQVYYAYKDAHGAKQFELGPIDLTISRGETIFLVGGNGSGKSTLLKLLTGLYYPQSGTIWVDNHDIHTLGLQSYRELFSAIFSDYHLFHRVYGVDWQQASGRVSQLVSDMELVTKTAWTPEGFDKQDLSTGQKKRLALIVSLVEDRPVFVFDEWAADQDPQFREKFYTNRLPELKQQGKTIIAATHDDAYFKNPNVDRVLKMELGKFVPFTRGDT